MKSQNSNLVPQEGWNKRDFAKKLKAKGRFYHIHHPFHQRMNSGGCSVEEVRGWVANRYYYQINIPLKDAAILANCDDQSVRQLWVQRILDHDGNDQDAIGGIEAWLRLGEACGLTRAELIDQRHVLPGVRFAVDAYVNFARQASWQLAASSSLTELFAPQIHQKRLDGWPEYYPWIDVEGLNYFRNRLSEARRDVEHGLQITLDYFATSTLQQQALDALQFKLDVLWSMLDAMSMAYIHQQPPYHNCPPSSHDDLVRGN